MELAPGQCLGEVGVLERAPRAATVVADTRVEALRVEADRFRTWVASNPRLADYLGTLQRIYPLTDGRFRSPADDRTRTSRLFDERSPPIANRNGRSIG